MLFVESPMGTADVIDLEDDRTTIGRAPDNLVVLDDLGVSKWHAAIEHDRPFFILKDLQKRGITVNGKVVHARALFSGDVMSFGGYRLRFVGDRDYEEAVAEAVYFTPRQ